MAVGSDAQFAGLPGERTEVAAVNRVTCLGGQHGQRNGVPGEGDLEAEVLKGLLRMSARREEEGQNEGRGGRRRVFMRLLRLASAGPVF